ncbi:MAG: DUF2851 family protein [Muribaculaceae bacterium]|nr:DUF2851 family protein [Muribaculaceae bacterium]
MEKIMQYIWQWRLYGEPEKQLTDGRPVRIVHPGTLNIGAGPDFFNARIDIDGMCWVGNVELHVKASDWHRHGHDSDRGYDSVILHVVGQDDDSASRSDGSVIPQLLLPFDKERAELYKRLTDSSMPIRCGHKIADVSGLHRHDWIERAGIERLTVKSERLHQYVAEAGGDWNQGLFVMLARALGFNLNGEPLERLARSLPLNVIAKYSDSLFQLEALLMGVAGLLAREESPAGDAGYYASLRDEYSFLAHKHGLSSLPASVWKMSGARPGNMPQRKLAHLARLLQREQSLFSALIEAQGDVERLMPLFQVDFEGYWSRHFTFGPPTTRSYKSAISADMVRVLLINVVAPLYHAYGCYRGDYELEELAQTLLCSLPAERNSIMKMWAETASLTPTNAFESQALIHIKRQYCDRSECLRCRLGHKLMRLPAAR